jgi:flagellar biosynthesis protein FliQ
MATIRQYKRTVDPVTGKCEGADRAELGSYCSTRDNFAVACSSSQCTYSYNTFEYFVRDIHIPGAQVGCSPCEFVSPAHQLIPLIDPQITALVYSACPVVATHSVPTGTEVTLSSIQSQPVSVRLQVSGPCATHYDVTIPAVGSRTILVPTCPAVSAVAPPVPSSLWANLTVYKQDGLAFVLCNETSAVNVTGDRLQVLALQGIVDTPYFQSSSSLIQDSTIKRIVDLLTQVQLQSQQVSRLSNAIATVAIAAVAIATIAAIAIDTSVCATSQVAASVLATRAQVGLPLAGDFSTSNLNAIVARIGAQINQSISDFNRTSAAIAAFNVSQLTADLDAELAALRANASVLADNTVALLQNATQLQNQSDAFIAQIVQSNAYIQRLTPLLIEALANLATNFTTSMRIVTLAVTQIDSSANTAVGGLFGTIFGLGKAILVDSGIAKAVGNGFVSAVNGVTHVAEDVYDGVKAFVKEVANVAFSIANALTSAFGVMISIVPWILMGLIIVGGSLFAYKMIKTMQFSIGEGRAKGSDGKTYDVTEVIKFQRILRDQMVEVVSALTEAKAEGGLDPATRGRLTTVISKLTTDSLMKNGPEGRDPPPPGFFSAFESVTKAPESSGPAARAAKKKSAIRKGRQAVTSAAKGNLPGAALHAAKALKDAHTATKEAKSATPAPRAADQPAAAAFPHSPFGSGSDFDEDGEDSASTASSLELQVEDERDPFF